jgi:TnpA family transposase
MTLTNYQIAIIVGCFTLLGALVGSLITHRLTMNRDRHRAISEINKALLDEMKSIDIEMNTVRTGRDAILFAFSRMKLGSVNFTAFKKTCTRKQQEELDAAYVTFHEHSPALFS